jgi:hypothetical protein
VEGVTGAQFEHLSFASTVAPDAGSASIAVMVNKSTGIVLFDVTVTAAAGAPGAKGADWSSSNWCPTSAIAGSGAGASGLGGTPGVCDCAIATSDDSLGGPGGGRAASGSTGQVGGWNPATQEDAGINNGAPGSWTSTSLCISAHNGAPGGPTDAGGSGAIGTLGASGWTATAGGSGTTGSPGQGGGGGGGTSGIGGAGGGAGGCGGTGGSGGGGGGASIGIAVVSSTLSISGLIINVAGGGSGGPGGAGEQGQHGGAGGSDVADNECSGGNGG